jgi:hypothetical protein
MYGFVDASRSGFDSTVMLKGGIRYQIGTWGPEEDETSNFREFENVLVAALREEEAEGHLDKALIFMCMDNSTVESAIVKGNPMSEKLFALALEVQQIEMQAGARLVISHVSGKRMKAQGIDGVSR